MKIIYTIIILVFSVNAFSQVSFFIGPQISIKGNYGSDKNTLISDYKNEFFSYDSRKFLLGSSGYGIKIGAGFNNRIFLDFSWAIDETRSGNTISFSSYSNVLGNKRYSPSTNKMYLGIEINRLQLSTQFNLLNAKKFEDRNFFMNPFFVVGIGANINSYKQPSMGVVKSGYQATIDQDTELNVDISLSAYNKFNINTKIGIGADFLIANKYFFTLSVYSTNNITKKWKSNLSVLTTSIKVETATDTKIYDFSEISRGTGLYFEISRRFQLYPWLTLGKRKREVGKI